jgi:hypothetical protein
MFQIFPRDLAVQRRQSLVLLGRLADIRHCWPARLSRCHRAVRAVA